MAGVGISSSSPVMTPPPSAETPSASSSSTGKRAESDGPGQGDSGGTSPTTNTSTTTSATSQPPPTTTSGTTTTTTTSDPPTQTTTKTTHTTESTTRTTHTTSDTETTSTHTTTSTDEPSPTSTKDDGPTSTNPPNSPTNGSNNTPNATPQNSASPNPSQTVTSPSASQSYTTITTVIDGQSTTFTSPLPTSLSTASPNSESNRRNAIIAGSTAAGIILLLLLLSVVFVYRRKQLSSKLTLDALLHPRRSKRERRGLLDGEFEDDDDEDRRSALAMRAYRDFASTTSLPSAYSVPGPGVDSRSMTPTQMTPVSASFGAPLVAAAPGSKLSLASMPIPQPAPPAPGEPEPLLVTAAERVGQMERIGMPTYNDPFNPKPNIRTSLDLSLGNIVDEVMGPSPTAAAATHALSGSSSSTSRSSPNRQSASYDSSFSGGVPLDRHSTQGSLLNDPFRSASPTKAGGRPDGSVYFPQADTSGDLAYDGIYSQQGRRSTSPSGPAGIGGGSGVGLPPGAAAPKKPSPLARALSSASSIVSNGIGRAL